MTYRDEGEAWLARRARLERAVLCEPDLERREASIRALETEDDLRRTDARRRLPILARARTSSPCDEAFEAMLGQGPVRTCARCDRDVFDPARMTPGRIEALAAGKRLHRRPDGTMMFADCEPAARQRLLRRAALVIATIALVCAVLALVCMPVHVHRIAPIGLRSPPRHWAGPEGSVHLVRDGSSWSPSTEMVPFSYYAPPHRTLDP